LRFTFWPFWLARMAASWAGSLMLIFLTVDILVLPIGDCSAILICPAKYWSVGAAESEDRENDGASLELHFECCILVFRTYYLKRVCWSLRLDLIRQYGSDGKIVDWAGSVERISSEVLTMCFISTSSRTITRFIQGLNLLIPNASVAWMHTRRSGSS